MECSVLAPQWELTLYYVQITNVAANKMKKTSIAYLKLIFIVTPIAYLFVTYAKSAWIAIERAMRINLPNYIWIVLTLLILVLVMQFVVGDIRQIIEQDKAEQDKAEQDNATR